MRGALRAGGEFRNSLSGRSNKQVLVWCAVLADKITEAFTLAVSKELRLSRRVALSN